MPLADGLQVGEDLAGVELVGQRVDHRHPADRGHLLDAVLAEGAPHDRGALPVEHPGGVGDRLAAAELAAGGLDDQRVAAELGDADAKETRVRVECLSNITATARGARPAASALGGGRVGLERGGEVEHLELLGRGQVVVAEEVRTS